MGGRVAFYYFRQQKPRYHCLLLRALFFTGTTTTRGGRQAAYGHRTGAGADEAYSGGVFFFFFCDSLCCGWMNGWVDGCRMMNARNGKKGAANMGIMPRQSCLLLGDRLRYGKAGCLGCLVGFWVVEWGGC